MDDLISRQAALKAVSWDTEAYMAINMLPSAQPESCEYWDAESNYCALNRPSAQPEITFDDVMRYCRQRCLYVIPAETFHGLLGGKPMNDIKALIEELEIQHEAWGKQYTFAMIIRDIEKFAAGGDADAEREEG